MTLPFYFHTKQCGPPVAPSENQPFVWPKTLCYIPSTNWVHFECKKCFYGGNNVTKTYKNLIKSDKEVLALIMYFQ